MEEQNKAVLRRFFDEVVNRGELDAVDELIAPEMAAEHRRVASMWREAFPDLVLVVDDMLAEGDRVAATVTITGTHDGTLRLSSFREVAPTGRRATWTGMDYVRVVDGRIVERRSPRDLLRMLHQLGAVEST
jgi:predicted ester cyclase